MVDDPRGADQEVQGEDPVLTHSVPIPTAAGPLPASMAYCLRVRCSIRRAIFCRAA